MQGSRLASSLTALGVSFALASGLIAAQAGQTPQRPVFRAGATFVSVDAYPRRNGKVVEGLTAADFQILEDGKPQNVESFEFIRISPVTPDAERRDPNTAADGYREAADPHNRVFVVYLDMFHTTIEGSFHARQTVVPFLMRAIGPTDLFAVMSPEVPINQLTFGRRTETIEAELETYWTWGERSDVLVQPRNPHEQRVHGCGGDPLLVAYREDLTMTHLEALAARLGSLRDERKNILFISEGWVPWRGPGLQTTSSSPPNIPTVGVGPGGKLGIGSSMSGNTDRSACETEISRLSSIDHQDRFRNLTTQARRSNVAFYPVDVGGLRTGQLPASIKIRGDPQVAFDEYRRTTMARLELLRTLAETTDGTAIVDTNDLPGAVRKVADDLSAYYLLGYYSSNTAPDGRFRRIDVKVKTPDTEVSARRGYMAPTAEARRAEEAAASRPVTGPSPVNDEIARLGRIRADAQVYSAATTSAASIDVIAEIAARESEGGRWKNGGAVSVAVSPLDGNAAPVTAEARIEPAARSVLMKVPLAKANVSGWRVRTRVTGDGGELEDIIEVAANAASLIGPPTVFRATPSLRAPLRPAADDQFRRNERVHVEWPLARPLDERIARLLSRRGDALPVPVTLTERADGDRTVLAADVLLASLAEGDYVIEIAAAQGGEKVQRLLAFRVVR